MPFDFAKPQSSKPENAKTSSSATSSSRPSLGNGMAEKAAKVLEERKNTIDKHLKEYGA